MTDALPTPADVPSVADMPLFGLGTYRNTDPQQCEASVRTALEMGYRHVDTARMYGNEAAVGAGIAAADVPREEVFVATKLWHDELAYDEAIHAATESADRLGVGTIDLLYVHWPAGDYDPQDTLAAFAELYDRGTIANVGVSNFTPERLREAVEVCDAPIFANQVECHPLLPQADIRAACEELDVAVVAYAPLARGDVADVPALVEIADAHDATPYQVSLAWLRQHGVAPIPKATGTDHIRENWASVGLELTDTEIDRIDGIDERKRLISGLVDW